LVVCTLITTNIFLQHAACGFSFCKWILILLNMFSIFLDFIYVLLNLVYWNFVYLMVNVLFWGHCFSSMRIQFNGLHIISKALFFVKQLADLNRWNLNKITHSKTLYLLLQINLIFMILSCDLFPRTYDSFENSRGFCPIFEKR
jgi:hypothetical protein